MFQSNLFSNFSNLFYHICAADIKNPILFHPSKIYDTAASFSTKAGFNQIFFLKQVHSNTVVFIEKENKKIFTADGMVTFKKGVSLCILHADCQCAFYFDPVNLQLGAVHAGFRGLLNGIHENTIDLFLKNGSKVENIYVYVGPSLGLDHAEFINYKTEFPLQFHKYNNQNNHFDLKLIAKDLMLQKGIPKSNIEISPVCSFSDSSIFSYRRANKTNSFDKDYRNFSFIGLK